MAPVGGGIGKTASVEARMRYVGRLTDWHGDKGYGFVVPHDGGDRAFVHITAFERPGRRPTVGDLVSYAVARDARGRPNAVQVRFAGARPIPKRPPRRAPSRSAVPRKTLAVLAFAALGGAVWRQALPFAVAGWYGVISVLTWMAYAWDKAAAQRSAWRTRETTLHAFALCGGWPGALLAQDVLRHKTRKPGFLAIFWLTVASNIGALAWWLHAGAHLPG